MSGWGRLACTRQAQLAAGERRKRLRGSLHLGHTGVFGLEVRELSPHVLHRHLDGELGAGVEVGVVVLAQDRVIRSSALMR